MGEPRASPVSRLTAIEGESGVGKSRLVAEMLLGLPDDATVLGGRCSEDRLGCYLPFVEVLRHVVDHVEPASLRAALGGRGELTRLLPELVYRVADLSMPTKADAGSEQRLLFEAVSAFLANLAPMILVIEDLHWADEATLALLTYLVRDQRLPGLVVFATARPFPRDSNVGGLLTELARDVEVARFHLDGLTGPDLGLLVSDVVGSTAPTALVDAVAAATEGNPLFAEEMTMHLVDSGRAATAGDVSYERAAELAGVPERIREMVVRRLLSLSADGIELLSVGAVIGREFELSVAAAASGLTGSCTVDASDDAVLSGMVVETGPGRLAFSHALVRNAISSRMTHARRAGVHRRVAEVIEDQWPANQSMAAEIAHHWAAVTSIDPTARATAATWAVRAGDAALASAAADDAIDRYEQASMLWANTSASYVDVLIRLGSALQYGGRADDADRRFREAGHLAVLLRNPTLQARAAIGLGRRYPYWETDEERIETLEAALAALDAGDQALRVVLMCLLVTHLINGFRPQQARRRDDLADELREVAAGADAAPDLLLALGQIRIYDCIEDPVTLGRVGRRLLASARSHNDLRVEAGARFVEALASLDMGNMHVLSAACEQYTEVADGLGDPRDRSQAASARSTIAFIQGRYEDAARLSDEALRLGGLGGDLIRNWFITPRVSCGQSIRVWPARCCLCCWHPASISDLADSTLARSCARHSPATTIKLEPGWRVSWPPAFMGLPAAPTGWRRRPFWPTPAGWWARSAKLDRSTTPWVGPTPEWCGSGRSSVGGAPWTTTSAAGPLSWVAMRTPIAICALPCDWNNGWEPDPSRRERWRYSVRFGKAVIPIGRWRRQMRRELWRVRSGRPASWQR